MYGNVRCMVISIAFHAVVVAAVVAGVDNGVGGVSTTAVQVSLCAFGEKVEGAPEGGLSAAGTAATLEAMKHDRARAVKPELNEPANKAASVEIPGKKSGRSIRKELRYNVIDARMADTNGCCKHDPCGDGQGEGMAQTWNPGNVGYSSAVSPVNGDGGIGSGRGIVAADGLGRFGEINGPRIVDMAAPIYPERARRVRADGRVLLCLRIAKDGSLADVTVVEAAGYGMDEAAVEAVRRSTFGPAVRDGYPVDSRALLPIRFEMADAARL